MKRLNHDATTEEEIFQYYQTRALQLAPLGYMWSGNLRSASGGFTTAFTHEDGRMYDSYYGLKQYRGNGHAERVMNKFSYPVLTIDDCNIVTFMQNKNIPHKVAHGIFDSVEYKLIENFYADDRAERSGVLKMNHIDEGMYILRKIGASDKVMKAFCLHPMIQRDEDMAQHFNKCTYDTDPLAVMLALEYRNIANQWLSDKVEMTPFHNFPMMHGQPKLSPVLGVNRMLIADKIQNYKDFKKYHLASHDRSVELQAYFEHWLQVLEVRDFEQWEATLNKLYA